MTMPLPLITETEARPDLEAGFGALMAKGLNLPLQALDVSARLVGLTARTVVKQTFINTLKEPVEAVYVYPLPDRAAVTTFRMTVADRLVEGQLMERGQAREAYDDAIQTGHQAAMAEEDRPGVFTMQVGNLMPGDLATVELEMVGPLSYTGGEAVFRFPLVVAPRYIPGAPSGGGQAGDGTSLDTDQVPDASRISPPVLLPGFPNPVRLSLSVEVDPAGLPLTGIRSSLHAVSTAPGTDGRRTIRLQPGERLNRDFMLRLTIATEALAPTLVCSPDDDGQAGTFALTLIPPQLPDSRRRGRDVVFVLDRSGSMDGWKMIAARNAIAGMVDTLTEGDRFTVMAFDDRRESPPAFERNIVAATDHHRHLAWEFLAGIEARGGTEMARPLDEAITRLVTRDANRDQILVLVTDGQVGNEDDILLRIGRRIGRIRIFTVGIDTAVNEGFLNRLASVGRGACELVESEARLLDAMDSLHRQIAEPVLTNLRFLPDGMAIQPETIVPSRMPDLFAETPLVIYGRYKGRATGQINLQGTTGAGTLLNTVVPATVAATGALSHLWARGRVRELEDRYAIGAVDRQALEQEITRTSLQFGVLCRFTAFVAIDASRIVNAGGQVRRMLQPVEAPQGWEMFDHDMATLHHSSTVACLAHADASDSLAYAATAASATEQAENLLEHLEDGAPVTSADRLARLTEIADDLADLLETVRSDGTDGQWVESLERYIAELGEMLETDKTNLQTIDRLWAEILGLLEKLAGKARRPNGRQSFWK